MKINSLIKKQILFDHPGQILTWKELVERRKTREIGNMYI